MWTVKSGLQARLGQASGKDFSGPIEIELAVPNRGEG